MNQSPQPRRTRKLLATRQRISDIATGLFIERGFDKVTVDEIAEAADVSRMTVFNHFPRKEDMFFDLNAEAREDLVSAFRNKAEGVSPIEAVRLFAHWAVAEQRPYVQFSAEGTDKFLNAVQSSDALKSRALTIREDLTDLLTTMLLESVGCKQPDATVSLASTLLVATWVVASLEAHRVFGRTHNLKSSNETFLSLVDQGAEGVRAVVRGTQYA